MADSNTGNQRAAARKTAAWMTLCAVGVYLLFIYMTARGVAG